MEKALFLCTKNEEKRVKQMKKTWKLLGCMVLCAVMLAAVAGCGKKEEKNLWKDAKYTEDTALGEGSKTVKVVVEAEDKKVTFTIATDREMLGDALLDNELIAGEESEYGLYVKEVNGMKADYDADKAYWGFFKDGEYMMTGIDLTEFADGEQYELVYTKE